MPSFELSFTTTQPLRPQNQPGKCWCSAAGSFWDDLQSTPLLTSWMRGWSFFGLRTGLLFGPWYVLNVMLLRCKTQHAERISNKCSYAYVKLLHWRVLVKKEEPWQPPEMHHQSQSQNKLSNPEPLEPVSAPVSAMFLSEVAEHVPTTLRKMPRLSEPGPLGMRAEHWYDFGSLAGNSDLFVQVIADIAAAAVPSSVLQYLKSWTDHSTCQTHRRPQTTSYDVISPQTCAEICDGSKERISGQVCWTIAVRCWKTGWCKHDDQNHPVPRGS